MSISTRLAAITDPPKPWLQTANRLLAGIGIGFSTGLLGMRIYVKAWLMKRFWWDDILLISAWVFAVGTQAVILWGYVYAGFGVHTANLTLSILSIYQKAVLAAAIIYIPALALAKLALLMLYYRLLCAVRMWQYTIYLAAFFITGYSIALVLALIFACHPLQKNWDASITNGSCINREGVYLATAITNTVSDVILILIPIRVVRKLRMPLSQKIGVVCIFGIGCLTIITSIVRLATLWPLVTSTDQPYRIALASIFINVEASFIIICGCLPYLRQFLRRHVKYYRRVESRNRDLERSVPEFLHQRNLQRSGPTQHIEIATDEAIGNDIGIVANNRNGSDH